jgi:hypothetical protein
MSTGRVSGAVLMVRVTVGAPRNRRIIRMR